jgi:hypothetical protein
MISFSQLGTIRLQLLSHFLADSRCSFFRFPKTGMFSKSIWSDEEEIEDTTQEEEEEEE